MTYDYLTGDMLKSLRFDTEAVIAKIPDPFIDEDIAHAVQVLFCDLGAGADYEKLKFITAVVYRHALPTGARNDKVLSLLAHIVRPKPAVFNIVRHGREVLAGTTAYNFINAKIDWLWKGSVWDRRHFDIVAEFAENYEHLQIPEIRVKWGIRKIINRAAENKHLFQKVNFDLFVQLVMKHGHLMETLLETLQKVALRAKSESLDTQLMAGGLLNIVEERSLAHGGD